MTRLLLLLTALAAVSLLAQQASETDKSESTAVVPIAKALDRADVTTPNEAQLLSRIALLEAQLDAANKTIAAEHAACWTDDPNVANTRWVAAVALKKAAELGQKASAPK